MTASSVLELVLRHPLASLAPSGWSGARLHAVGGIVRDAVLGKSTADLDLTVEDGGEALAQWLAEHSGGTLVALGGDRFSSYRVVAGAYQADIWDRRGGSLHSDLERRDLTINAVALDLDDGALEDPFDGLGDLGKRRLRATKADCFERDPLRVLRLARFSLLLDRFTIDPETASAARAAAGDLETVARERVREELGRILEFGPTRRAFETLGQLGVLEALIRPTPEATAVLVDRTARLDRGLSVTAPLGDGGHWTGEARRRTALLLLSLAIGGDDADVGAGKLESSGLATRKELREATRLLERTLPTSQDARRLFLDRHRRDWPLALAIAAAVAPLANSAELTRHGNELALVAAAEPELVEGLEPLLDGHQAARALGIPPGPELGEALQALARARALGRVQTRAEAESFLSRRAARRNEN